MTTNQPATVRPMRYAIVTNPGYEQQRYACPNTAGQYDQTERLTDAQSFSDAGAASIAAEAYGLTDWHLVGIGPDFQPVPLCTYCDDTPVTEPDDAYCHGCLVNFYGSSVPPMTAADWAARHMPSGLHCSRCGRSDRPLHDAPRGVLCADCDAAA